MVRRLRSEYREQYDWFTWCDDAMARRMSAERGALLQRLAARVEIGCNGTKLDCRRLSPGCRCCAAGAWSCLFVNGICDAGCFFCPAEQRDIGQPITNGLTFSAPEAYLEYLVLGGFSGVAFSGGEPLRTGSRTIAFMRAVRRRFGDRIYLWMYTNGRLVSEEWLRRLHDEGLDELRFNIVSSGYDLGKVLLAGRFITRITIEIPAIPEDEPFLAGRLEAMGDAGVAHLNLHQLRLTPYNARRFRGRPYTMLHGEKATVLESELAALRILEAAQDLPSAPAVNYCSHVYKHRFQGAGMRVIAARLIRKGWEDITANGYLRRLEMRCAPDLAAPVAAALEQAALPAGTWIMNRPGVVLFAGVAWDHLRAALCEPAAAGERAAVPRTMDGASEFSRNLMEQCRFFVSYDAAAIRSSLSFKTMFTELRLTEDHSVYVERLEVLKHVSLTPAGVTSLMAGESPCPVPDHGGGIALCSCEHIPAGLAEYY
ncbi:hypothetical protein JW905_15700 [bacterium]|nr:hypothetical protein [candidate division CSSED10-310 bacterium]